MNLKDQICKALCDDFIVRAVPLGYAIRSPFDWFSGDRLVFYVRRENDRVRFEDDGATVAELEAAGVDFETETRLEALNALLKSHNVFFDRDTVTFHTSWRSEDDLGRHVVPFLSFLNRLQDLQLLNREIVRSTFKEDLFSALQDRLSTEAALEKDSSPTPSLRDHRADVVVRHKSGRIAAIFAVSSEQKALEAILLSKEVELQKIDNVVPFLIYEEQNSPRINRRTHSRALNSDLNLAVWGEEHSAAVEKVARHLAIQAA